MAFWNRNKPESLGSLAGGDLNKKPEFDSKAAKQESLSFEPAAETRGIPKGESLESYQKDIAGHAEQKAQATEGKMSKWMGALSKRLDSWASSMKERGQKQEQARITKAGEKAVKKENAVANMRGNVDYNRILSLNLNSPESVQTQSGKLETLFAAADEAPAYLGGKIDKARENLGNRMSLANESMTQLHLTPRTEGEKQTFAATQERDARGFEQRRKDIGGNLGELNERRVAGGVKVTVNVDANYLMALIRQAEAAGVSVNIKNFEAGGITEQQRKNEAEGSRARAGLGEQAPDNQVILGKAA